MTNISNLNLSKGTIPPLLKYKIVFLGDQAVGKSSIINRFIYDIFDGNEHVVNFLFLETYNRDRLYLAEHIFVR
jgi:GTPase SAR1 family protein